MAVSLFAMYSLLLPVSLYPALYPIKTLSEAVELLYPAPRPIMTFLSPLLNLPALSPTNTLYVAVDESSKQWVHCMLAADKQWVCIHPGASDPTKQWPIEKFAQCMEQLYHELGVGFVVIAQGMNVQSAKRLHDLTRIPFIDLAGHTDIKQLTAVISCVRLLISNDSGPVHIAAALHKPVISLFGRNDPGMSPVRWRPLGRDSVYIHHPPQECTVCDAHACSKGFRCYHAISVQEIVDCAKRLFKNS